MDRILVALQTALHDQFWQFVILAFIALASLIIMYLQLKQGSGKLKTPSGNQRLKESTSNLSSSSGFTKASKQDYLQHQQPLQSTSPAVPVIQQSSIDQVAKPQEKPGTTIEIYGGHTSVVRSIVFSPDSKYIASGSSDETVHIWDAITGKQLQIYKGHSGEIDAIVWSPDGKCIYSKCFGSITYVSDGSREYGESTIQVWNAMTGKTIINNRHNLGIGGNFTTDGKRFANDTMDNVGITIEIWDTEENKKLLTHLNKKHHNGENAMVSAIAWSPDGRRIASGGYKYMQVWDTENGNNLLDFDHSGFADAIAWSPDGKKIALSSQDGVRVIDAATGDYLLSYPYYSHQNGCVVWSPDGRYLANSYYNYTEQNTVRVWDAISGTDVHIYRGHASSIIDAIAWSPNGKYIVSGDYDNTVQVWVAPK